MRIKNLLSSLIVFYLICVFSSSEALIINGWDVDEAVIDTVSLKFNFSEIYIYKPGDGVDTSTKTALEEAGWGSVTYVSRGAFMIRVRDVNAVRNWYDRRSKSAKMETDFIKILRPEWKVERTLWETRLTIADDDNVSLVIYCVNIDDQLRMLIARSGAVISNEPATIKKGRLGVKVTGERLFNFLQKVSKLNNVYSIEWGGGARILNDNAAEIVQSGAANDMRPLWDRGIYGADEIVAVLDTGVDFDNCYFAEDNGTSPPLVMGTSIGEPDYSRRKVVVYDLLYNADFGTGAGDFDNQGHGTAVSGNALGSRSSDPLGSNFNNGMAPLAKIVVQDAGYNGFDDCADLPALGCPVIDLTPFLDQAWEQGARIHNNSWGDRENFMPQNTYTAPTADMDDAVWRHREFVIVCAAGNSGVKGDDTVGSPSVGKNVISIGASSSPSTSGGNAESIASFSSHGWASDGRIKPDVTAPGITITASSDKSILTNNCTSNLIQGTSMASPVTGGCAALVREYFRDGWYPSGVKVESNASTPSAALVKAVLINGAVDMKNVSGAPPNRVEGWGRVQLENSLYFAGDARNVIALDVDDYFSTVSSENYFVNVSVGGNSDAGAVKITLVWSDYPASPLAESALVNDLDLVVTNRCDLDMYKGNNFDELSGLSIEGGDADSINNVEMVVLDANTSGSLCVEVRGSLIAEGPQGFALVMGGDVQLRTVNLQDLFMCY